MKRLFFVCLICVLALSACSGIFNPPPIVTNPPTVQPTQTPVVLVVTPTFTALPPTATPTAAPSDTPAPLPTATLPPPTVAAPTATAPSTALTLDQLRGATLTFQGADLKPHTITLKEGKFQQGSDPAQAGYISVALGDRVAFGDLNGDGVPDAAITIVENYGGTGSFVSVVAILNHAGQPQAVATALIDDRAMINSLTIKDGELLVDAVIHGVNDPMCCPGLPTKRAYRLVDNNLVLSQLSTTTNGVERLIQIDSPAYGTEINSPFVIKGSVSVSPFENTLGYRVYVPGAKDPVQQASFQVKGDGLGGPGTFELAIDPSKINFKGPVRIEIEDVSAADGSFMAVGTVFVVFK